MPGVDRCAVCLTTPSCAHNEPKSPDNRRCRQMMEEQVKNTAAYRQRGITFLDVWHDQCLTLTLCEGSLYFKFCISMSLRFAPVSCVLPSEMSRVQIWQTQDFASPKYSLRTWTSIAVGCQEVHNLWWKTKATCSAAVNLFQRLCVRVENKWNLFVDHSLINSPSTLSIIELSLCLLQNKWT